MLLKVNGVTPSQNQIDRMHWAARHRLRGDWYWLVRVAIREAGVALQKQLKEPKRVHIVRVSKRLLDDGNVPSGAKYLIDALVKEGVLVEDSRKWARITFDQKKTLGAGYMEVSIEPWNQIED